MDYDTTPPLTPEPAGSEPAATGPRWPRRVGALAGVAVLAAATIGFGTAGAQTGDEDDAADDDAPAVVHSGMVSVGPIGSGDMSAFDECLAEALPDDGFSIEAPPNEPLDEAGDGFAPSPEELEALDAEFEAAFDELDARFEAAEAECRDQLPEDLQAEMDAWKDFDECIEGQFDDLGTIVTVDGEDGLTVGSFGDDAGTITIAKAADGSISVDASGSGTVSDGPDAEAELLFPDDGACEHLLPEGADT